MSDVGGTGSHWLVFVIIALAVWRISYMLVSEDGPWWMFGKLRKRVGVEYDQFGIPYGDTWIAQLFLCIYCMSVWVGIAFTVFWVVAPKVLVTVSIPFALSAIAIALSGLTVEVGGKDG